MDKVELKQEASKLNICFNISSTCHKTNTVGLLVFVTIFDCSDSINSSDISDISDISDRSDSYDKKFRHYFFLSKKKVFLNL